MQGLVADARPLVDGADDEVEHVNGLDVRPNGWTDDGAARRRRRGHEHKEDGGATHAGCLRSGSNILDHWAFQPGSGPQVYPSKLTP